MSEATPLIVALDRVLHIEGAWKLGLTAEDGWSESLAVLTPDMLYLLEPTEPEPLSPFGRTWRRIQLSDVTDLTVSSMSGGAGAEMLRIGINAIFQGDILLRSPAGAAEVASWVAVLEPTIAGARSRALHGGEVPDSVAACLGQHRLSRNPSQDRLALEPRWWETAPARCADGRSGRESPVTDAPLPSASSGLDRRRPGGAGVASATVARDAAREERHEIVVRRGDADAPPRTLPPRPWAPQWMRRVRRTGMLEKRRDGLWRVGWTERLLVLWVDETDALLLYYKRVPESSDELLGELRGVINLKGATIEVRQFDESDEPHASTGGSKSGGSAGSGTGSLGAATARGEIRSPAATRCAANPAAAEAGAADGGSGRGRYLRIIAAETPAPEPFYVLPKRLALLDLRVADGGRGGGGVGGAGGAGTGGRGWGFGGESLPEWEAQLRSAVRHVSHPPAGLPPDTQTENRARADSAAPAGRGAGRRRVSGSGWLLPVATLAVLNACLQLARSGSEAGFALSLLLANLLACFALFGRGRPLPTHPLPPPPAVDRKLSRSDRPRAGMACGDPAALSAPLARNGDGREFRVRCGPDYPRFGGKAPSAPAMYELLSSDFGRAPHSIRHVAERMTLPSPPCLVQGRLPPLLVVSVIVPVAAPALLGEADDEECVVAVLCFGATDGAQAASREAMPPPAIELLARFNAEAAEKRMEAGVFKVGSAAPGAWGGGGGRKGQDSLCRHRPHCPTPGRRLNPHPQPVHHHPAPKHALTPLPPCGAR